MGFAVTADPQRFDEACDWFLKRVVLDEADALALGTDAGRRAFWIGNGLQLSQIQRVFDEIAKANESGEPFEAFRKRVLGILKNDAHAETVFRNATQRSLNAGRYEQMRAAQKWRPYWMHDSVLDSRTTKACKDLDGVTLPADHEHWKTHWPPGHHRCRRGVRSLRKSEGEKRLTNVPPIAPSDPGFGAAPDADPVWKPDPTKRDPALMRELDKKAKKERKPPAKPKTPPKEHDPKHWAREYEGRYGEAAECVGWGRAMLERGMDRSASDVLGELERLQKAGHPTLAGVDLEAFRALPANRPIRSALLAQQPRNKALIALQEHTRTIQVGEFVVPDRIPAMRGARRFYELSLDKSIARPYDDLTVRYLPGQRPFYSLSAGTIPDGPYAGVPFPRRQIVLGTEQTSKAVHELAHAIEDASPKTLARSRRYLKARAKGRRRKLQELHPGYRDDEHYFDDEFIGKYWGKDYGERATEITPMGYEALTDEQLAELADNDPDTLHFLLGQLAGR